MLWNTQSYLLLGREQISCKLSEWCVWLFLTCGTRKRVPLSSPGHPATKGFKRFLKTDLMTIFYSSPRKNCKKPREKSIFYSLSIRGVAEVALNQCSWGATYATNTVWGVPDQKMQKHLVKVVFAGLLPFEDFRMKPCKDGRNFR